MTHVSLRARARKDMPRGGALGASLPDRRRNFLSVFVELGHSPCANMMRRTHSPEEEEATTADNRARTRGTRGGGGEGKLPAGARGAKAIGRGGRARAPRRRSVRQRRGRPNSGENKNFGHCNRGQQQKYE